MPFSTLDVFSSAGASSSPHFGCQPGSTVFLASQDFQPNLLDLLPASSELLPSLDAPTVSMELWGGEHPDVHVAHKPDSHFSPSPSPSPFRPSRPLHPTRFVSAASSLRTVPSSSSLCTSSSQSTASTSAFSSSPPPSPIKRCASPLSSPSLFPPGDPLPSPLPPRRPRYADPRSTYLSYRSASIRLEREERKRATPWARRRTLLEEMEPREELGLGKERWYDDWPESWGKGADEEE
ncbi:hypothetical protein JCM8547_001761 [Rhodosporidiobolus lusitaniae]